MCSADRMSRLTKYFAAFGIDSSRIAFIATVLTLGAPFEGIYAANYPIIHHGSNPGYDNVPITPATWEEVDLKYSSLLNGKRYQNTINLLRPIIWLHQHGMDEVGNTVTLSLPKFGIHHIKAYVTGIKLTKLDTRGMNWSRMDLRPVISRSKRYALDVRAVYF